MLKTTAYFRVFEIQFFAELGHHFSVDFLDLLILCLGMN